MSTWDNWCVNWRGLYEHDTCEAGIDPKALAGEPEMGWMLRVPCIRRETPPSVTCEHCRYPTDAEIKEHDEMIRESFERTGKARRAIVEHTGGRRGVADTIPCPVCGTGVLAFRVSGYNGHIHAKCSTDKCVHWIE